MARTLRSVLTCLAVGMLLGVSSSVAQAAPLLGAQKEGAAAAQGGGHAPDAPEFTVPWARLVGGTTLVAALACFAVYALKKMDRRALKGGRYMELLEVRPLGRKAQLFLVKVGGRVELLAVNGEHVAHVGEFAEDELPEPEMESSPAPLQRFSVLVRHLAGASR